MSKLVTQAKHIGTIDKGGGFRRGRLMQHRVNVDGDGAMLE